MQNCFRVNVVRSCGIAYYKADQSLLQKDTAQLAFRKRWNRFAKTLNLHIPVC